MTHDNKMRNNVAAINLRTFNKKNKSIEIQCSHDKVEHKH